MGRKIKEIENAGIDELIDEISTLVNIDKIHVKKVFHAVFNEITASLLKCQKIAISDFGTFSGVERKARTGRNPETGEKINIRACIVPKFRPSKTLSLSLQKLFLNVARNLETIS